MTSEGGACAAPTLPAMVHHAPQKPRSMSRRAGQCCVLLPLTSIELVSEDLGLSLEFLAALALQRVHRGGVARSADPSGDRYFDRGRPVPSGLTHVFDELADSGLTALAKDSWGLRRVTLTEVGAARYAQLSAPSHPVSLANSRIPPLGSAQRAWKQLRWVRCSDDERLPVLTAAPGGGRVIAAVSVREAAQAAVSLPVRSPCAHMHALLRRSPLADRCVEEANR